MVPSSSISSGRRQLRVLGCGLAQRARQLVVSASSPGLSNRSCPIVMTNWSMGRVAAPCQRRMTTRNALSCSS